MKYIVSVFCFYLFVLIALPSVRAIKLTLISNSEVQCGSNSECKTGEFIMNLCFSPVQITPSSFKLNNAFQIFYPQVKKTIFYYQNSYITLLLNFIWNPPKVNLF